MTRYLCPRGHLHQEGAAFCTVCGAGPVVLSPASAPWILGTGLSITPCAECTSTSFCSNAGACLRKEIKT